MQKSERVLIGLVLTAVVVGLILAFNKNSYVAIDPAVPSNPVHVNPYKPVPCYNQDNIEVSCKG